MPILSYGFRHGDDSSARLAEMMAAAIGSPASKTSVGAAAVCEFPIAAKACIFNEIRSISSSLTPVVGNEYCLQRTFKSETDMLAKFAILARMNASIAIEGRGEFTREKQGAQKIGQYFP